MMLMAMSSTARLGRKTTRDDEVEQSRRALSKNLIRPLSMQDHQDERFRRPALPHAGVQVKSIRWRRKLRDEAKPWVFSVCLWARPVSHIYRTSGGIVSRARSQTDLISKSTLPKKETMNLSVMTPKNKTTKGNYSCKATGPILVDHPCTCHTYARPRPEPGQAGEASECACGLLFPSFTSHLVWCREPTI